METDDGTRTLRRKCDKVTWHSESGALAESSLVFIRNSQITEILADQTKIKILEIGFGTGLNFWLASSVAIRLNRQLEYYSLESDLLDYQTIKQLKYDLLRQCQPAYDLFSKEVFDEKPLPLSLARDQVLLEILPNLDSLWQSTDHVKFDAIFLDPFAPEISPEFWNESFFEALFARLAENRRLVTYCVKSKIQRRLKSTGFNVEKTRGPVGGKREVLIGIKESSTHFN